MQAVGDEVEDGSLLGEGDAELGVVGILEVTVVELEEEPLPRLALGQVGAVNRPCSSRAGPGATGPVSLMCGSAGSPFGGLFGTV